jgi:hypothetical protein
MKKPAVESSEPSQYLQSMFDAFPALQEKVQLQAGLTWEDFPAERAQPRSSQRLLHLSQRVLPVRLYKEMQEAFRVWVVRFLHFEPILIFVYLPINSHQNSFLIQCHNSGFFSFDHRVHSKPRLIVTQGKNARREVPVEL